MKRVILAAFTLASVLPPLWITPAAAQQSGQASVVSSCGSASYPAGTVRPTTQDTTGTLCSQGGGGGGSNPAAGPTGSAVPADASYNGLNVGGTLRGQTGVNPSGSIYAAQTDMTTVNGVATQTGAGAVGTGSQRVAVGQDTTTIAGSAPGTAGTPSTNVVSVQGVASGTTLPATISGPLGTQTLGASVATTEGDGNLVTLGAKGDSVCGTATGSCSTQALIKFFNNAITADPCGGTKSFAPFSLTASGQIITGTASKKTYICSINLMSATAQNIALVEGTGSTCATNIFGLAGGTTAATGWNLSANGGHNLGDGIGTVAFGSGDANATAANVCLLLSSTGQTSGTAGYVQQ